MVAASLFTPFLSTCLEAVLVPGFISRICFRSQRLYQPTSLLPFFASMHCHRCYVPHLSVTPYYRLFSPITNPPPVINPILSPGRTITPSPPILHHPLHLDLTQTQQQQQTNALSSSTLFNHPLLNHPLLTHPFLNKPLLNHLHHLSKPLTYPTHHPLP